ncbi:AI-2E family transporter [Cellulomonas massiliensis]|uniref:AI-2E family transporter n=1 Tax=Cellulomonas massiliensis TaxID=1465811 RepID=UPI000310FE76|nr:AI-2E family transporter [Cellulomonas massiliensis]
MSDLGVPTSVQRAAAWSWRILLVAAATALGLFVVVQLKVVVVPVAIALLLTVLLAPLVGWLQRRLRAPRALASGLALGALLVLVVGLLVLAGQSIVSGIADLWNQAQEGIDKLLVWLSDGPLHLSTQDLTEWVDKAREAVSGQGSAIASGALHATVTVGHVLAGSLIALFCTFFFLLDGRQIWTWFVGLLPRGSRENVHQAGRRGLVTLGAYTRTQILVAGADSIGIGVGAAILGVPLALPLAILVFLGSFIPIVGAVVTGAVAVLVALVAKGPVIALVMLAIVLLVQQLEGHVLQPFLMGHAVSLHPVAVLLAVAAGSLVAGILGALFAVPVVAVINTVVLYLHGHDKFPQLGYEDHVAIRERGHPVLDRAIDQMSGAGAPIDPRRRDDAPVADEPVGEAPTPRDDGTTGTRGDAGGSR